MKRIDMILQAKDPMDAIFKMLTLRCDQCSLNVKECHCECNEMGKKFLNEDVPLNEYNIELKETAMKVKIREDLNFDMKNVVSNMLNYAGKEGEVIEERCCVDGKKCYVLDIDEGLYHWFEWMLESIVPIKKENDTKIKFKLEENGRVAKLKIEEIKDEQTNSFINECDNVNHPSHYTDSKIEVMDYIEDKQLNFARGNVIKYVSRAGKKDPTKEIEDLSKAAWYLNREIETLKGLNN